MLFLIITGLIAGTTGNLARAAAVTNTCADTSPERAAAQISRSIQDILYFDDCSPCGPSSSGSAGSAAPANGSTQLTYPSGLSDAQMADAIEHFIAKYAPNSPLKGLGSTIVASAKANNINPFIIPAQTMIETQMGTDMNGQNPNVVNANNMFGRTATSSQPNWQGAAATWYKWDSIKASVDSSDPSNQTPQALNNGGDQLSYIRKVYGPLIDSNDVNGYISKYAPPTENDTNNYIAKFNQYIAEMTSMAGVSGATDATSPLAATAPGGTGGSTGGSNACCPTSSSAASAINGSDSETKILNYMMQNGHMNLMQASAVAGNLKSESSYNPNASNGSHWGIAQWDTVRYTRLQQFAKDKGTNVTDFDTQLHYLGWEMGIDGPWNGKADGGYASTTQAVLASGTIADAARAYDDGVEQSGEHGGGTRTTNAQQIYDAHKDQAPAQAIASTANSGTASSCASGAGDWVFYTQWDPNKSWAKHPYWGGTVAENGCGPTAVAMIVATWRDKSVTPDQVADYITSINGQGQQGKYPEIAAHYGLTDRPLSSMDEALSSLKAGKAVIISGTGSTPFTSAGHFIVLRGIAPDGKVYIADPNSGEPGSGLNREDYNTKEWDPNALIAAAGGHITSFDEFSK